MAACPKGFNSCRFKTYGQAPEWSPTCVRCGRVSADAQWRARGIIAAPKEWPHGAGFKYLIQPGEWVFGWRVGHRTAKTQFFWKPEYDGNFQRARRMKISEWNQKVERGQIKRDWRTSE